MTPTIKRATFLCGLLAFLVNPSLGCGPGDDVDYGEAELRAAVEGSWEAKVPDAAGERMIVFTVAPAPPPSAARAAAAGSVIRPAAACGSRDFYRSAAACSDIATLHLAGQVAKAEAPLAGTALTGRFVASGKTYGGGSLTVTFADGGVIVADLDGKNTVVEASHRPARGPAQPIQLARAAR